MSYITEKACKKTEQKFFVCERQIHRRHQKTPKFSKCSPVFYFCNHDSNLLENTTKLLHDVLSVRYKASWQLKLIHNEKNSG